MEQKEKAALVACLLEVLGHGEEAGSEDTARLWPSTGHPHYESWGWNPRGPSAYRLAGRIVLHRGRRLGRY